MGIEWSATGFTSAMTHRVLDSSGNPPTNVLNEFDAFNVEVKWSIPPQLIPFINPSDSFRLRVYAESMGPGPEVLLANNLVVATAGQLNYTQMIPVAPNILLGEGRLSGGQPVAGLYKVFAVLQHLSANAPTGTAGLSDLEPMILVRAPNAP